MKIDMKNTLVYGFAAFAAWTAYRTMAGTSSGTGGIFDILRGQRKASGANVYQNTQKTTEVLNGSGGQFGNGWRYFSDGTAIDPQGNYYQNGALIWSPA